MDIKNGELVSRISYGHDLVFKVVSITKDVAVLHGVEVRLAVDAPLHDLVRIQDEELEKRRKKGKEQEEFSYRLFRQDYQLMKEKREYQSTGGYNNPSSY